MNCSEHLQVCKAACCKVIPFTTKSFPGDHVEDYYTKKGLKIIRQDRNSIMVLIPHVCEQLTSDNKCKLHEKGKPLSCVLFNEETAKTNKYYVPETCIYAKKVKGL